MKGDRGFEIVLALMIIGLCCILAKYGVVPSNIKLVYFTFFSICFGAAVMIVIMNTLSYILEKRRQRLEAKK
jgi:hypothetical protein